jgi:uncharacterized membrane protein YcjF (UPF0283 family)
MTRPPRDINERVNIANSRFEPRGGVETHTGPEVDNRVRQVENRISGLTVTREQRGRLESTPTELHNARSLIELYEPEILPVFAILP